MRRPPHRSTNHDATGLPACGSMALPLAIPVHRVISSSSSHGKRSQAQQAAAATAAMVCSCNSNSTGCKSGALASAHDSRSVRRVPHTRQRPTRICRKAALQAINALGCERFSGQQQQRQLCIHSGRLNRALTGVRHYVPAIRTIAAIRQRPQTIGNRAV
jgi:hypothetical protein